MKLEENRHEEQIDAVTACLRDASQEILRGDFAVARSQLDKTSAELPKDDLERVEAARSSMRLDPAALVVVVLCLAGIATLAILTLFHGGQ
ncbi:MAG: hypothetical protein JRF33_06715 [Deltaproteobacteria bacterium]|nr:hypothetical protein [Deltaproteobacteria bacterium]